MKPTVIRIHDQTQETSMQCLSDSAQNIPTKWKRGRALSRSYRLLEAIGEPSVVDDCGDGGWGVLQVIKCIHQYEVHHNIVEWYRLHLGTNVSTANHMHG